MNTGFFLNSLHIVNVPLDEMLLVILLVLAMCFLLGELFSRLHLDSVVGYMIGGVILGPQVLNLINPELIGGFAEIGVLLIIFMSGMKVKRLRSIVEERTPLYFALTIFTATFIGVFLFFFLKLSLSQALFAALAYSVVDLGVPAKILLSKKIFDKPYGKLILNTAITNIIFGLLILVVVTILFSGGKGALLINSIKFVSFAIIVLIARNIFAKFSRFLINLNIEQARLFISLILLIGLAYLSDALGLTSIIGAFLAGVIVAKGNYSERPSFMNQVDALASVFFVPLFFAWFGAEIDLVGVWNNIGISLTLLTLIMMIKFSVSYVLFKKNKQPMPGVAASSMLSLDVESMIILLIAVRIGVFQDNTMISIFAPMVPLTTVIVAVLVNIFGSMEMKNLAA